MRADLIDEYVLQITDGGASAALRLVDTKTTSTGVVIATYQPARSVQGERASD
jgi:hypothetical protein